MPGLAETPLFTVQLAQFSSAAQQSSRMEFQTAASSKLKAGFAKLPGGYVAWCKLVPDSKKYLLWMLGPGAASGYLAFLALIKMKNETCDMILHICI